MRSPTVRPRIRVLLGLLALLVPALAPASASAHPLGNFTVNHYAALRVGSERIDLDIVVDFAEIPAFQERIRIDADGDGTVSDEERDAARVPECEALTPELSLTVDGRPVEAELVAAGLSFPAGAGGVPTMRVVCELRADPGAAFREGAVVAFEDRSAPERIGWREIVVLGDGVTISAVDAGGNAPSSEDVSARLTSYPESLLSQPLDVRSVAFTVSPGGAPLVPFSAPDAAPVGGVANPSPTTSAAPGSVPGGVGGEIPTIFQAADLTPLLALGSILLAMALGAGHALTPGHGKTLMAAYLVGTRGTVRHAAGLGLAVTVSHTLGILVLALLVTGAESVLPADVVVRAVPVIAAIAFVAIGAWMVASELRRRRAAAADAHHHECHHHEDAHHHDDAHEHAHDHGHEHSHGGVRHSHLPPDDRTLSWRSLFALGLAGGIIPSTNALIILLGTIVVGRAAFGIVLVVAFGLGMALVLAGVGAVMVLARDRLARLPSASRLGRLAAQAPLLASVAVLGIGLWLTAQALTGGTTL